MIGYIDDPGFIERLKWSSDGEKLAILKTDGEIHIWNMTANQPVLEANHTYSGHLIDDFAWESTALKLAIVDESKLKIFQLWPEHPYVSNIIKHVTNVVAWSSNDDIAYSDFDATLHIIDAPIEDDPVLVPTPTGTYYPPTETPTPFGTPPPPTLTPFPFPVPDAGPDATVGSTNGLYARVTLNASGTIDPANLIIFYRWYDKDDPYGEGEYIQIANGEVHEVDLVPGVHHIRLTISYKTPYDYTGHLSDEVVITVLKP